MEPRGFAEEDVHGDKKHAAEALLHELAVRLKLMLND
jgi:hypothetical protein